MYERYMCMYAGMCKYVCKYEKNVLVYVHTHTHYDIIEYVYTRFPNNFAQQFYELYRCKKRTSCV